MFNCVKNIALKLFSVCSSQFLLNGLLGSFSQISCLNVFGNSDKRRFQGVEGAGIKHLHLDSGGVWSPRHKEKLFFLGCGSRSLILMQILKVVQAIAAILLNGIWLLEQIYEIEYIILIKHNNIQLEHKKHVSPLYGQPTLTSGPALCKSVKNCS